MFSDNFLYFFDTSFSRKSIVKFYSHTLCNVYSHLCRDSLQYCGSSLTIPITFDSEDC